MPATVIGFVCGLRNHIAVDNVARQTPAEGPAGFLCLLARICTRSISLHGYTGTSTPLSRG